MNGIEHGDTCNRDGCGGIIEVSPIENCSCHITAPCSGCSDQVLYCPECGWDSDDEQDAITDAKTIRGINPNEAANERL